MYPDRDNESEELLIHFNTHTRPMAKAVGLFYLHIKYNVYNNCRTEVVWTGSALVNLGLGKIWIPVKLND